MSDYQEVYTLHETYTEKRPISLTLGVGLRRVFCVQVRCSYLYHYEKYMQLTSK